MKVRLLLTAGVAVLLLVCQKVQAFQLPDSISSALTYRLHERLNIYASDLYADPTNPRLSHEAKFSEYLQDPSALANPQPSFILKLFRENYYNTSFSVASL